MSGWGALTTTHVACDIFITIQIVPGVCSKTVHVTVNFKSSVSPAVRNTGNPWKSCRIWALVSWLRLVLPVITRRPMCNVKVYILSNFYKLTALGSVYFTLKIYYHCVSLFKVLSIYLLSPMIYIEIHTLRKPWAHSFHIYNKHSYRQRQGYLLYLQAELYTVIILRIQ